MKRFLLEAKFAFLAWLIPFVVSVAIFPLKQSHAYLFESIMGFILVTTTVLLGCIYLCSHKVDRPLPSGFRIGITWLLANWLLDLTMFSSGPMKMPPIQYFATIGTAYFIIPVITTGLGFVQAHQRRI
ncbi:MAG TPA: hypothetical protein VFE58_01255 [Tepidisphaeraceae bacterium]|jgi:hypothetical protein|nr:hypothetical protein [Tepidisphaeraceae bacterium]